MLTSEQKEIDGVMFTVFQMPYMTAGKLLVRLMKYIGPAIAKLDIDLKPEKKNDLLTEGENPPVTESKSIADEKFSIAMMGEVVTALFKDMTETEFEKITEELLYKSLMGTAPLNMVDLQTKLPAGVVTLLKLIAFALGVNYGRFLGALPGVETSPLGGLMSGLKS